jgi:hypothetical protein
MLSCLGDSLTFHKCHIGYHTSRQYQMMGQKLLHMMAVAEYLFTREQSDLMFHDILNTFQVNYPSKIPWQANNLPREQENAH